MEYNSQSMKDGYGAQLIRIIGIYGLARATGSKYLHKEILSAIEEFSYGVSGNERDLKLLTAKVNSFFELPSSKAPSAFDLTLDERSMDFFRLIKLLMRYGLSRKKVLVRILFPFPCTDRFPSLYRAGVKVVKRNRRDVFLNHSNHALVVHVRMAYGRTNVPESQPRRHLPFEYFRLVISALRKHGEISNFERIKIHTDLSGKDTTWRPTQDALVQEISLGEPIVEGAIRVRAFDLSKEFHDLGSTRLDISYCDDFFQTFLDMSCANIFIMSRSAFSYLSALFSDKKVVYPENHGHGKPRGWISSLELGLDNTFTLIRG